MRRTLLSGAGGLAGLAAVTAALRAAGTANHTTIALTLLLVVLGVAACGDLVSAVGVSIAAMIAFNFFFLPPAGTLAVADSSNWVALAVFLAVGAVASQLSASARSRAREASERRTEVTRLFDLTRDVLLTTDRADALNSIARSIARRFNLGRVAICVRSHDGGWTVHEGGAAAVGIDPGDLDRAFAASARVVDGDERARPSGRQRSVDTAAGDVTLSPIRLGLRTTALLATGRGGLEIGTRDAVAGIAAIALERLQFLEERRLTELARQRSELSSALLASLSHDLRTPLTAMRAAISNLESGALDPAQRRQQARLAGEQSDRLARLFEKIVDMARIDAGAIQASRRWTTPAEIVDAALAHAAGSLHDSDVVIDASDDTGVEVDPRMTSSALAHLVENAARYSPPGAAIHVKAWTDAEGLRIVVRDQGDGLAPAEIERLFQPFYRGEAARHAVAGTGMGLSITRGLLNVQGGRVWAENVEPRGSAFSIAIPARVRAVAPPIA
jgi:two-component system sensor histidine kinase KdpD